MVSGADPFVKDFHGLSLRRALGTVYLPCTSQMPVEPGARQTQAGQGGYSKITLPESKVSVPIPHNTLYTT